MGKTVLLSKIANVIPGQSPKSEFYTTDKSDIPFLQGNRTFGYKIPYFDTYCSQPKKIAKKGKILMTVRAPVGEFNCAPEDVCIGRGVCEISSKTDEDDYLYYVLLANQWKFKRSGNGSIFNSITKRGILNMKLDLPDEDKKDKFTNSLLTIDNKIELNSDLINNLEKFSELLYHKWFVNFNFPNENGEEYKNSGGEFSEVNGKLIPKGWKYVSLFNAVEVLYGYPFDSKKFIDSYSEDLISIVRIRDILENTHSAYTSEIPDDKYKLKFNDLLIGMDGNFHINQWHSDTAYVNQRVARFRKNSKYNISMLHLKHFIKRPIKKLEEYITGTTVAHLSDKHLKRIDILLPDNKKLSELTYKFNAIENKIGSLKQQNEKLKVTRNLLIRKMI